MEPSQASASRPAGPAESVDRRVERFVAPSRGPGAGLMLLLAAGLMLGTSALLLAVAVGRSGDDKMPFATRTPAATASGSGGGTYVRTPPPTVAVLPPTDVEPVPAEIEPDAVPEAADAVPDVPPAVTDRSDRIAQAALNAVGEMDEAALQALLDEADAAFESKADHATSVLRRAAVALAAREQAGDESAGMKLEVVRERIRVIERRALAADFEEQAVPTDPAGRVPHAPPADGQPLAVTIKQLGNFRYDEEVGGLPQDVEGIDGVQVRMPGFMIPVYQTDQIREFVLVPDIYECCFGEPPGVEHTISVVLPGDKAVSYYSGEIEVTGRLRVYEEKVDGYIVNLFTVQDVSSVRATGR